MKLTVEQKHINMGVRGDCCFCPIGLALIDKIGKDFDPYVCIEFVLLKNKKSPYLNKEFKMSIDASVFVASFDKGDKKRNSYKPFTFELKEKK